LVIYTEDHSLVTINVSRCWKRKIYFKHLDGNSDRWKL
jgi:hypothetical protein